MPATEIGPRIHETKKGAGGNLTRMQLLKSLGLETHLILLFVPIFFPVRKRTNFFKLIEKGEDTWDVEEKKDLLR